LTLVKYNFEIIMTSNLIRRIFIFTGTNLNVTYGDIQILNTTSWNWTTPDTKALPNAGTRYSANMALENNSIFLINGR